jgi:hypothetical protein
MALAPDLLNVRSGVYPVRSVQTGEEITPFFTGSERAKEVFTRCGLILFKKKR